MFQSLPDLADAVADGDRVGLPGDAAGVAMAATRELIRRDARDLRLFCLPGSGLAVDVLVGAGAVAELETAGADLGEHGPAPCLARALAAGTVRHTELGGAVLDARLTAAAHGAPFIPLGARTAAAREPHPADWPVIANPLSGAEDEGVLLVPAVALDVALFHCAAADEYGNVFIGRRHELATLARAAARTLVTVEEIVAGSLLASERDAAGALASEHVDGIALAPMGARPLALGEHYGADGEALAAYARAAASAAGFRTWLDQALGQAALA